MKQLSGTDAAFVHFDNPRTPMIIGGVYIFEGKKADGQIFTYENFIEHLNPPLWLSFFEERSCALLSLF